MPSMADKIREVRQASLDMAAAAKIMRQAASRMEDAARKMEDAAARMGGARQALIKTASDQRQVLEAEVRWLRRAFRRPFLVWLSVGILGGLVGAAATYYWAAEFFIDWLYEAARAG